MDSPLISACWPRKLSWQPGTMNAQAEAAGGRTEVVTMSDGAWRPCTCTGATRHVSLPHRRSSTMRFCRAWDSRPARFPCIPPADGDHPNWTSAMAQRLPASAHMTMSTTPVIGVDVGASTMSAGLVCPDGNVLATAQLPTQGEGRVVDTLLALIDRALASADERWSDVAGIGVGLPGLVDVENGFVRSVPGSWLPELSTVPLVALIQERSGYPVFIDNDVNALALGEWMFGPDRGVSSLVTLAIGTGMGGGLILDGQLVRGHLHSAGEIGHLAVSFNGPICACGRSGCLSTYLAGGMMAERARERLDHYPGSIVLTRAGNDPNRIGSALLFEAAASGDPLACGRTSCAGLSIGRFPVSSKAPGSASSPPTSAPPSAAERRSSSTRWPGAGGKADPGPPHVRSPAGRAHLLPGHGTRRSRSVPPAPVPGGHVQPDVEAPDPVSLALLPRHHDGSARQRAIGPAARWLRPRRAVRRPVRGARGDRAAASGPRRLFMRGAARLPVRGRPSRAALALDPPLRPVCRVGAAPLRGARGAGHPRRLRQLAAASLHPHLPRAALPQGHRGLRRLGRRNHARDLDRVTASHRRRQPLRPTRPGSRAHPRLARDPRQDRAVLPCPKDGGGDSRSAPRHLRPRRARPLRPGCREDQPPHPRFRARSRGGRGYHPAHYRATGRRTRAVADAPPPRPREPAARAVALEPHRARTHPARSRHRAAPPGAASRRRRRVPGGRSRRPRGSALGGAAASRHAPPPEREPALRELVRRPRAPRLQRAVGHG